jgi:hypothetical protein
VSGTPVDDSLHSILQDLQRTVEQEEQVTASRPGGFMDGRMDGWMDGWIEPGARSHGCRGPSPACVCACACLCVPSFVCLFAWCPSGLGRPQVLQDEQAQMRMRKRTDTTDGELDFTRRKKDAGAAPT